MPRVPDASSVTRLRAIQSSAIADPTKRSASYAPAQPALLYSLRASDAGRGMFPAQSYLANPVACGYVNPRHRGLFVPLFPPQIRIPISGTDFAELNKFSYSFDSLPNPDFDVVFVIGAQQPTNTGDFTIVRIFNTDDPQSELFGSTTIATSLPWTGATFTSSATAPSLSAAAGTFPGMSTTIQFRNVPVIANIYIEFGGGAYEP
jgi:hypothetical protein